MYDEKDSLRFVDLEVGGAGDDGAEGEGKEKKKEKNFGIVYCCGQWEGQLKTNGTKFCWFDICRSYVSSLSLSSW